MKYQRINTTTTPPTRVAPPSDPRVGRRTIWDDELHGPLPNLSDGEAWAEIHERPEAGTGYDPDTQRIELVISEVNGTWRDGWRVVDLTDEEVVQRVNEAAESHKQARLALARERAEAKELASIEAEADAMSDAEAEQHPELFPPFEIGKTYTTNERFTWPADGAVYKVLQAHTSALQWKPNEAVSLYVKVQTSNEWASGVSYEAGAEVTYNGTGYRVLQPHTSQLGWEPPNVPALWAAI